MKIKEKISKRKQNGITSLFLQAITYRVPIPVTKVIVYADNTAYPICPRCSLSLDREYMAFCSHCGQKLNWDLFEYARVVRPGKNNFSKDVTSRLDKTYFIKDILGGFILERAALGKRIRESRINKGYTQQDLADRAEIGVVYISEIERGIKMPSLNVFIKIIAALDVSADYVLRDELPFGKEYIYDEITQKLKDITPKQRKTVTDILDAYLHNID